MVSYRRTFTVNPDSLAPEHPYSFDSSKKSCQIAFFEFRGIGPPSTDFGYPGDVYVDLAPGAHALYWRDRHGHNPGQWRRWRSVLLDKVPLYKFMVSHPWASNPQESDLYLWVDPDGVTWTSRAAICASRAAMVQKDIAIILAGEKSPDVDALVAEILAKMLQLEESRALPPIKDTGNSYSTSSPAIAHRPRSYTDHRGRSNSSASQYSPPEPSRRIPPINSPPYPTRPAPFRSSPPPTPILYTPSHHSHRPLSATPSPIPTTSDSRHNVTAAPRRQMLAEPPPYGEAGPSKETASSDPSTLNPHPGATEQEMRESFAWNEMQRAQYAEAHFKRELRIKNRELSKCTVFCWSGALQVLLIAHQSRRKKKTL
ncbi:hypothetical protein FB45DRAFT_134185 [Roridomyces roridus]|uniref:Uncharacterized protein n=1 Tax=Roridomyces roridus TaxID=1738132 RepID=A0AAD7BHM7_9AGAR|nr:hypothetical protein FB45DRAFT_134185 [Roridomyces roridus]